MAQVKEKERTLTDKQKRLAQRIANAGIAPYEDVEKAMPELVRTRDDGSLAVDYPKLVALAFAAIKELKAEIDELKGK